MQVRNTFPKSEHLYGETVVEGLYTSGTSFFHYPYKLVYMFAGEKENVSVRCLVSAPKKRFKHAVDRNRLKRLMRESYRKNKHELWNEMESEGKTLYLAIHYVGQKVEPYSFMEKKMVVLLSKVAKRLKEESNG